MRSQLEPDVDPDVDPDVRPVTRLRRYPVNELIRTYLQQSTGPKFFRLGTPRPERPRPTSADELWDYLGDFA
jgi:hypothetical protein